MVGLGCQYETSWMLPVAVTLSTWLVLGTATRVGGIPASLPSPLRGSSISGGGCWRLDAPTQSGSVESERAVKPCALSVSDL
jgi:hypothetical protein